MTVCKATALWWWAGGLASFAVTHSLHRPLVIETVPGGILDHQAAPDAATVDRIQAAWLEAGLAGQAQIAMIADLVFIGIYGLGCVLAGLYFHSHQRRGIAMLGWVALIAGVVFLVTDYAETIAQVIQLSRFEGSDALAGFASIMGPPKVASFLIAFVAIIAALIWERFAKVDSE